MFDSFIRLVREIYCTEGFIPLHEPRFNGREKQYLSDVIDSTFVSSVGGFVDRFENEVAKFCGAKHAVATVNGTSALHLALQLAGVQPGDQVITQAVSFVATCNAIHYCGAEPVFLDIDRDTLGLSSSALADFLAESSETRGHKCWNKRNGKRIAACLPMHTFGHPCDMPGILQVCRAYHIPVVEDAAEALGSRLNGRHCGTFGLLGVLSFNGNKIITTGGGGVILTDDEFLAERARHLSTTAKLPHRWRFEHDCIGYNYRMPNLNAALGLAQCEQLSDFLRAKRLLADRYIGWAKHSGVEIIEESAGTTSNYWLNALLFADEEERDHFLNESNEQRVMTRPLWELMANLPMYAHCQTDGLPNSRWLAERLVNIPSSAAPSFYGNR